MAQDTYFTILKVLTEHGVNRSLDISEYLQEYFLDQNNFSDIIWSDLHAGIEEYLLPIKDAGHIAYSNLTPKGITMARIEYWKHIKVTASIKAEGILFYYQKIQIDTNINSNKWSRRGIYSTAGLALLSLLISASALLKSIADSDDKQQIQELKTQLTLQAIELTKQQTSLHRTDSLLYLALKPMEKRK